MDLTEWRRGTLAGWGSCESSFAGQAFSWWVLCCFDKCLDKGWKCSVGAWETHFASIPNPVPKKRLCIENPTQVLKFERETCVSVSSSSKNTHMFCVIGLALPVVVKRTTAFVFVFSEWCAWLLVVSRLQENQQNHFLGEWIQTQNHGIECEVTHQNRYKVVAYVQYQHCLWDVPQVDQQAKAQNSFKCLCHFVNFHMRYSEDATNHTHAVLHPFESLVVKQFAGHILQSNLDKCRT